MEMKVKNIKESNASKAISDAGWGELSDRLHTKPNGRVEHWLKSTNGFRAKVEKSCRLDLP